MMYFYGNPKDYFFKVMKTESLEVGFIMSFRIFIRIDLPVPIYLNKDLI